MVLLAPAMARAEWIAAASLGHAATRPGTVTLARPARQTHLEIPDVDFRGESFRSPPYYALRLTWIKPGQWVGIEGEFIHAKAFAETSHIERIRGALDGVPIDARAPLASVIQRLAMSHGLNFLLANVVVRHEVVPRLVLAARVGAGPTLVHAESTIAGNVLEQYQSGGFGVQAGGGIELTVWGALGAVGEYKFTETTADIDIPDGTATIPVRSHHGTFGVMYRF